MADTNRHVIRKYTATSHVVTVYAGTDGSASSTGDNKRASSAKLNSPIGIAIDFLGNVYFADTNNYRIRRVDWGPGNNRTITTIAGNGLCCWSGSSPTLVKSYLTSDIYGLAVTPYGTLYFPSEMKYSVRAMQVPTSGNLGTTCGNCYLPSSAGSLCCQTCSQVVAAHIALQLTYNSSCFEQCNPNGCPALCSASACIIQPSGQPSNQPTAYWGSFVGFNKYTCADDCGYASPLSLPTTAISNGWSSDTGYVNMLCSNCLQAWWISHPVFGDYTGNYVFLQKNDVQWNNNQPWDIRLSYTFEGVMPGSTYYVGFWQQLRDPGSLASWTVSLDGTVVYKTLPQVTPQYIHSASVVATSTSLTLLMEATNNFNEYRSVWLNGVTLMQPIPSGQPTALPSQRLATSPVTWVTSDLNQNCTAACIITLGASYSCYLPAMWAINSLAKMQALGCTGTIAWDDGQTNVNAGGWEGNVPFVDEYYPNNCYFNIPGTKQSTCEASHIFRHRYCACTLRHAPTTSNTTQVICTFLSFVFLIIYCLILIHCMFIRCVFFCVGNDHFLFLYSFLFLSN